MILRVFLVLIVFVDATMAFVTCGDFGNPDLMMNPNCAPYGCCFYYECCIACTVCTFPQYEVSHCNGYLVDSVCEDCLAGEEAIINWGLGVVCQSCPAGYDSFSGGSCCASPQYSSFNGCLDCAAGYAIASVRSGCYPCPQGSFESGHINCLACPAGKYNNWPGQEECVSVTLGLTYQDETGQIGYKGCSSACNSGQNISSNCTLTSNTVCTACTATCPLNNYLTGSCTGTTTTNKICNLCSTCSAGSYTSTACSLSSNTICRICTLCPADRPYQLENSCTGSTDAQCVSPVNHTSNSKCHFNVSIYNDVLYTTLDDYTLTAPSANSGQFYVNGAYTKQKDLATLGVPFNWGFVPGDDNYVEISDFIKANHPAGTFHLADNSGYFFTINGTYSRTRIITNDTINGYRPIDAYPNTRILMQHRSCRLIFNDLINNYYWTTNCSLNSTHCNKCSTCSNNTFQIEACNATTDTKCTPCTICTYDVIIECTSLQDTVCSVSAIQRPILFTVDTALGFLNPILTTEGNATFGFPILQRPGASGFGTLTATLGAFKLTKRFNSVLPNTDLISRKFSFTRASSGNLNGPLYFDSYSTQGAALATLRNSEITRKWNHGFLVLDQYGYAPTYTTITMTVSLAFTNSASNSCGVAVTTYTSGNVDNSGMANVEVVPTVEASNAFLSTSTCAFYSLSASATVAEVGIVSPSSLQNFSTGTVIKTYGTNNTPLLLNTSVPNLFTPNVNDLIVVAPTAAVFPGETINLYFYIQSSVMLLQGQVSIFLNSSAYTIGTPTYPLQNQVIPNGVLDTTFKQTAITSDNGGYYIVSFKRENADKSINGRQPEPCLIVPLTIVAQTNVLFRDIGLTIRIDSLDDAQPAIVALRGSPTYPQFANCYSRSTAPTIGQCNGTPTFRIQNNYPVDVLVTIYDGTFVDPWFTNTGYFTGLSSSIRTLYTKEYFMQGNVGSVANSLEGITGLTSSFTCSNGIALTSSGRTVSFATNNVSFFTDSVTWSYTATFASTNVASRLGSTRFYFWQPLTSSLTSSRSDLRAIYNSAILPVPWQQSDGSSGCVPYYESSTLALIVRWENTYGFPWDFNAASGISPITETFVTDVLPFITTSNIAFTPTGRLSWNSMKNNLSVIPSSLSSTAFTDVTLNLVTRPSVTLTIRIQPWDYNSNLFAKVTKLTVNLICGICDLSVPAASRVPGTNSAYCNEQAGSSVAISSITSLGASASNGLFTNQGTFASFNAEGVYYMVQQFQNASALVNMVLVNSESTDSRPDLRIEGSAILNLTSLNPALLTADSAMGYFQAQNRGNDSIAKADVLDTCGNFNGQSFISGLGLYDGRLSSPVSGTITMNGGQFLGAPNQPPNTFAPVTYPITQTFRISLTFANPTYTADFNDPQTTFNSSNTSVFTVGPTQQVTAVGPGTAILFITTLHPFELNVTVTVVAAFALTATSVPTSNAGSNNNELVLSPLGNSGNYQQASLSYLLSISDGRPSIPINVVTSGNGVYLTLGGALTQAGNVISVNTGALSTTDRNDNSTLVTAQIEIGVASWQSTTTQYTIDATNKFLAITSVTNLAFTNFVAGEFGANPQTNAVKFDLGFADGTAWNNISYNSLLNTVSFSCDTHLKNSSMDVALGPVYVSSTTGPASCNATSGTVTIFASSFRLTTLTLTTYNNLTTTLNFATNLKPPINDAAFSNSFTSVPIATSNFNLASDTVAIPLYLNLTGGSYISFNLFVTYDNTRLYVGAGKTVDTAGICITFQVNEDAKRAEGLLQIACLEFNAAQSGESVLVSTITFQRLFAGPELFKLGGYFDTLSTSEGSVVATGTPFKAGKIVFAGCSTTPCQTNYTASYFFNGTTSPRRRRSISNNDFGSMSINEAHIKYRNRRTIPKMPINTCNGTRALNTREQGDINGDCYFDADDYTLAALYLQGKNLSELQRSMFDQDRNGLNNSIDLILIGAALTSQAAFMSNLRISSPLKSSGCAVTIELDFEFLHNTPVSSGGAGGLAVFLDFETQPTNGFNPLSVNSPNEFQDTCDSCLLNSRDVPNATNHTGGTGAIRQFPKLNGGTVNQTGCSGGLFEMKFLRKNPSNGTSTFQLKLFSFMATQQFGITPYTIAIKNELDNTRLTTNNEQIRQFPFYGPDAVSPFLSNCKLKIAESPIDNSWKDYLNNTFGPKYPGLIDKTGPGYDPLWIFGGSSGRSRGMFATRTSPNCSGLKCNCEIGYYIASDCESNAGLQCTQCSNCSANEELKVPCDGTKTVEARECAIPAEHIAENFCRDFTVFFQGRLYATLDDINPLLPRNNSGQNTSLNLPANWGIAFDNISYLSAFASINQFGAFYLASTSGIYSTLNGTWYPLLINLNNATKKYLPNSTQPFARILLQHIECANLFSDGQYYLTPNCSMNNTHCQSCRICDPLNQYIDTPCTSSSDTICKNCNGLCSTIPLFSTSDLSVIVSSVVGGVVGVVFLSAGIYFLAIHYQKEVALNLYKAIPNQNYHLKKKRSFQV